MSVASSITVREAQLPKDRATLEAFVLALNRHEAEFAPDRRTDEAVGVDYFAVLAKRAEEHEGRIFVAERGSRLIGWLVSIVDVQMNFIEEDARRIGYVAELYVEPDMRGSGVGRALIERAEADFRARGLRKVSITVLRANVRARAAYEAYGFEPFAIDLVKNL